MLRTTLFALVCGFPIAARDLAAQTPVGSVAANLEFQHAVNHSPLRFEAIANQARVLCFIRLAENDSLFFLETFDKLSDDFGLDPVHFLAITNEPKAEIEKTVAKENVPTPIFIAGGDAGLKDYNYYKFPTVVVVDGAGKVRFCGMPGEYDELRDAVSEVLASSIAAPDLPAAAKSIGKLFEKWQFGDAMKALDKELAKPKLADADRAKLENAKARANAIAGRLESASRRAEKAEDWPRLVIALSRLNKECAGLSAAGDATLRLDALEARSKSDPQFAPEFAAASECAKAERLERERDWKKALGAYASAAKSHPDTKSGKFAAARADALKSRVK